jgi:hypothetical protein
MMVHIWPMAREIMKHETTAPPSTPDEVFEALANSYRRQLLFALVDETPNASDTVEPFEQLAEDTETDSAETTQIELVHVHLPKLDNHGFVDWDRETGEIDVGDAWDEIEPFLTLFQEHRDELPDGLL